MTTNEPQDFAVFLTGASGGRTNAELTDNLAELVKRVTDTRKKGSLTLTIHVEPMKNSDGEAVVVTDNIKVRLPEFDRKASVYYPDQDGRLHRNDPNQPSIFDVVDIKVDEKTGEVRDLPARKDADQ